MKNIRSPSVPEPASILRAALETVVALGIRRVDAGCRLVFIKGVLSMKRAFFLSVVFLCCAVCRATVGVGADADVASASDDGVCELRVDGFRVDCLLDGTDVLPANIFSGGDEAVKNAAAIDGGFPISYTVFLVRKDDLAILIDSGNGPRKGALLEKLAALSVAPEEIDAVLLTHRHGDHVAGLRAADGRAAFPNATVYLSKPELAAWRDESPNVDPLAGYRVETFAFGERPIAGILCRDASGHAVGQTSFELGDFLFVGDLFHVAALQLAHPEFSSIYDADPSRAAERRREFLESSERDGATMLGAHFPFSYFRELADSRGAAIR